MKLKLIMCISLIDVKSTVTEEEIKPYIENAQKHLKDSRTELTFDLLNFLTPISDVVLKERLDFYGHRYIDPISISAKSQSEFLLIFNLIISNTVKLPKDFISNDFQIKNLESLVKFLTFEDTSVSTFQNLAKTLLNVEINNEKSEIIINFLKNNFKDESHDFANFLNYQQKMLNFLSEKLKNFSEQEQKNATIAFLKTKIYFQGKYKNLATKKNAKKYIDIIKNGNKDVIIKDINKSIESTNEIVKNALNIMKFIDPKKLHKTIENQDNLTEKDQIKIYKGFCYIKSLVKGQPNVSIQNLVNAINIVEI